MNSAPLNSTQPVIVYLDFKSPYAYLAIDATRRLERELGLQFDWRPFVLDIPSYLGSASLDDAGQVAAQDRSSAQWAAVKYAYYDCRRYASINNLTIRGTTKIWDTNLAATAMLWVRERKPNRLDEFLDLMYIPFWKREFDIENMAEIISILENCGLHGNEFEAWANDVGFRLNEQFQQDAFDAGIYGVPTYVVEGELFFGREHLPRIKWHLGGNRGSAPDIENLLPTAPSLNKLSSPQITVGIDNSVDSLLGIPKFKALFDAKRVNANWVQIKSTNMENLMPPSQPDTRSDLHREYRTSTQILSQQRYAPDTQGRDVNQLIQQQLKASNLERIVKDQQGTKLSPFPGIAVTLNDEVFIGRQHLPLIDALIS